MSGLAWGHLGINLAVSAAAVAAMMLATFAYAMRTNLHSIVDTVWGLGFAVIAGISFALSSGGGDTARRVIVMLATAAWGLRLGGYIFWRNHGRGEDPRYAGLLRHAGGRVAPFVLKNVYWAQGRVMWVVSIPLQVAMYERAPVGPVTWIGLAVFSTGFVTEAVGDLQLARFKADPANRGRIMDRGVWSWTRHPNYFGDACVWWGLWGMACSQWAGLLCVFSPAIMTYMLVRRTGKALLEKTMRRSKGEAYEMYEARTSGFIPRPPKKTVSPSGSR